MGRRNLYRSWFDHPFVRHLLDDRFLSRQLGNSGAECSAQWQRLTAAATDVLGTDWRAVYPPLAGYQTIATDAGFTLTPATSPYETLQTGTLTADHAVTLSTASAVAGVTKFRITRTGAGAFNLNVGTGPLKALATNPWAEFVYDGSAYRLAAAEAL